QVLLHRCTGQTEVTVGSPTLGRNRSGLERTVGLMVNPIAVCTRVRPREPFTALLARVRQLVSEGLQHQDYPFAAMVEALGARRIRGRSPMFDVMLVFHRAPATAELAALLVPEAPPTAVDVEGLRFESLAIHQQE